MKLILWTLLWVSLALFFSNHAFANETDNLEKTSDTEIISDSVDDEDVSKWKLGLRGGLNGSQASFRDWQSGGVNTVSVTSSVVFDAEYRSGRWGYNNVTNLKYGKAKIDEDYRKTDDQIAIRNQFRYFFNNDAWSAIFDLNFLTQFDIGKDKDNLVVISEFFAPAYITQTLGINYKPAPYFNASFGFAMKQTFVNTTALAPRYGLDPGENFKNETGASFLLSFEKDIMENVTLTSSLETFSGFMTEINKTDYTFSNEISAKINSYLSTNFQFDMLYNADVIDKIQYKQVLSVGLTYRFM